MESDFKDILKTSIKAVTDTRLNKLSVRLKKSTLVTLGRTRRPTCKIWQKSFHKLPYKIFVKIEQTINNDINWFLKSPSLLLILQAT